MSPTNTAKLREAIALAKEANPQFADSKIANAIEQQNRVLFLEWARERLLLLVQQESRKVAEPEPEGPFQMFLEGFSGLAERVPVLAGRRGIPLAKATLSDLRKSLKLARFQALEKSQRIQTLIQEMEPYARTRRGLTVERYCELRAAGVASRVPTKSNPRAGRP